MIPGKDEKRSIDNLGMPGNFKYVMYNYWIKDNDDKWQQTRNR